MRRRHYAVPCTIIALALIGAIISGRAAALDDSADRPSTVPRIDNGRVWAIAEGPTHVYIGGTFTTVDNGVAREGLAAYDRVTGELDTSWDPGLGNGGSTVEVFSIALADGMVYVGGRFETARNGLWTRRKIVAFHEADGSSPAVIDQAWDPGIGVGLGNTVEAIAVHNDKVYVGGVFGEVNYETVTRENLAAFNKADGVDTGAVDSAWDPCIEGDYWTYFGAVDAIAAYGNRIYVGGDFCTVNGSTTRHYLAAFEPADGSSSGQVDSAWNPNIVDGEVFALAIADGKVYAGGSFNGVSGGSYVRHSAAAFNLAGSGDTGAPDPWDPNVYDAGSDTYYRVWTIATHGDLVFLGGDFDYVSGGAATRYYAAAFNKADGASSATVDDWAPGHSFSGGYAIYSMTPAGKAGVIVGGDFTYLGSWTRYRVAGFGSYWNPGPQVTAVYPADGATIRRSQIDVDVTFNEEVIGVDASDLVLSGPAAASATVGTPTLQMQVYPHTVTYRFPVSGLTDGALDIDLAPDVDDITDESYADLDPSPTEWAYTVSLLPVVASVPFFEGFESGSTAAYWDSRGIGNWRNDISTANTPYEGAYHLIMDSSVTSSAARNELTLHINLAGQSDLDLAFWAKEFNDEDHVPATNPFTSGDNFDGVAVSADGVTWHQIQGLTATEGISDTYQQYLLDLDAAVAACGLTYTADFMIRFNHYDDYPVVTDGLAFDNISISTPFTAPVVDHVTSLHADGTFPLGEVIDIQVVFDQAVVRTGAPTLELETGATDRTATYLAGSGTDTLVFRYTVQAGDATPDLEYTSINALTLNGGAIRDAGTGTLDANLLLPAVAGAGSLSANKDIAIDTSAPSVGTAAVQGLLTVDLTYNQAMGAGVLAPENYTLSGTGQGTLAAHPDTITHVSGNTYRLTWTAGEMLIGGDITITVTDVEDAIGNPIGTSNSATHAGGGMGYAPELLTTSVQDALSIQVAFNEAMGTGVTDPANYTISSDGQGTLAAQPDSVTLAHDFTYTLAWTTGEMFDGGDVIITIANAQDLAGNPIGAANSALDPNGGIGFAPEVTGVAVHDQLSVDIVFNEAMGAGVLTAANYTISGDGAGSLSLSPGSVTGLGANTYRLTWPGGEMLTGGDVTITAASVTDAAGNPIAALDHATHVAGGIGIAPELDMAMVFGWLSVEIAFNEFMGDGVLEPLNYTLSGTGQGTLSEHPDSVTSEGFSMYRLTWNTGEMTLGGDITITAANVKDTIGNPIGPVDTATDAGGGVGIQPELDGITVQSTHTVDVAFSEAMGASAGDPSKYTASGSGLGTLAAQPDSVALLTPGNYRLTWNTGEMFDGGDFTLTVTNGPLPSAVKDLADNPLDVDNMATHTAGAIGEPPTANMTINGDDLLTRTPTVALQFSDVDGTGSSVTHAQFSNDGVSWSSWQPFTAVASWSLESGEDWKTVHAQIRDAAGNVSSVSIQDTIALDLVPLTLTPLGDTAVGLPEGAACTLQVYAEGLFGEPVYEWLKQDPGKRWIPVTLAKGTANGPEYVIDALTQADTGAYRCQVSDETEVSEPVDFTITLTATVPGPSPLLTGLALALAAILIIHFQYRKSR